MQNIKAVTKSILFLGALFSVCSCGKKENTWFDNTFHEGKYNINSSQFFSAQEGDYYIYYYSLYCNLCTQMRNDILTFMDNVENQVYILGAQNLTEEEIASFKEVKKNFTKDDIALMNEEMIGKSDIKDIYLIGTPMIFKVSEHKISEVYSGAAAVHSFIEKWL